MVRNKHDFIIVGGGSAGIWTKVSNR
jgi:succinate dehydrogenase/fumarate reductase flavoprotein subunit